jgi:hypothetical protein
MTRILCILSLAPTAGLFFLLGAVVQGVTS